MPLFDKGAANQHVSVRVLDITGSPVTGLTPGGLVSGNANVRKANGAVASFALTNTVNWIEVDANKFPGVYDIVVPSNLLDVEGPMLVSVVPSSGSQIVPIATLDCRSFMTAFGQTSGTWTQIAPAISSISVVDTRTILVTFSSTPDPTLAGNPAHYSVDNGLTIVAAVQVSSNVYQLTTSVQTVGVTYTVTWPV